jgi:hypothetical protein
MIVNIAHPIWVIGTPPRCRNEQHVSFSATTPVMVDEVPRTTMNVAFRILETGRPPIELLTHADRSDGDKVWWPILARDGSPLSVQAWIAAMGRPSDEWKVESGFGALRDRFGWPDTAFPVEDMRVVTEDLRDESVAMVSSASANLMICDGIVWRKNTDPVYRVLLNIPTEINNSRNKRGGPGLAVSPINERAEKHINFRSLEMPQSRPSDAIEKFHLNDPAVHTGMYFRADERDEALAGLQQSPFFKDHPRDGSISIEVLQPQCIRATPSVMQLKATTLEYFWAIMPSLSALSEHWRPNRNDDEKHLYDTVTKAVTLVRDMIAKKFDVRDMLGDIQTVVGLTSKFELQGQIESNPRTNIKHAIDRIQRDMAANLLPERLERVEDDALSSINTII